MDITTLTAAGTAIGTTLLTNFATKGESAPVQTLNDLWFLAFGKLNFITEKKRAQHVAHLEAYKNEIAKAVSAIPDDNLIEPPMSIVGPALEASKFYIEEQELRKMFAKIIASAMDSRQSSYVHHAFIEIIKQLSPLDAEIIALFKENSRQVIANVGIHKDFTLTRVFYRNVFLNNKNCDDIELIASSLTNIERLGLLEISFEHPSWNDESYKPFEEHYTYKQMFNEARLASQFVELQDCKPWLQKGTVQASPLGKTFIKVCL
jgi:hypothetical protein